MKQKILCYYHYGMGGVCFWVMARTPGEIEARYPLLRVIEGKPGWISADALTRVPVYDIDEDAAELSRIVNS
jgi:hypothetical protein